MTIQLDEKNIINTDKITHMVCKQTTGKVDELTLITRIYFIGNDFIDCCITLREFAEKVKMGGLT